MTSAMGLRSVECRGDSVSPDRDGPLEDCTAPSYAVGDRTAPPCHSSSGYKANLVG